MRRPVVIALDGPAGAGKSTVGERLARLLGYFYFDTGALYRAIALRAHELAVDPSDEAGLGELVATADVVVRPATVGDGRQYDVLLDGRDITWSIRGFEVDRMVSPVAASAAVRAGLIDLQRRQVRAPGTVMAGRDIGTVVCPDADLKVYLEASAGERARRRLRQVGGGPEQLAEVLDGIERRDRLDSSRALAPLAIAEDAVVVDTEGIDVDAVVERIAGLLAERRPDGGGERAGDGPG